MSGGLSGWLSRDFRPSSTYVLFNGCCTHSGATQVILAITARSGLLPFFRYLYIGNYSVFSINNNLPNLLTFLFPSKSANSSYTFHHSLLVPILLTLVLLLANEIPVIRKPDGLILSLSFRRNESRKRLNRVERRRTNEERDGIPRRQTGFRCTLRPGGDRYPVNGRDEVI